MKTMNSMISTRPKNWLLAGALSSVALLTACTETTPVKTEQPVMAKPMWITEAPATDDTAFYALAEVPYTDNFETDKAIGLTLAQQAIHEQINADREAIKQEVLKQESLRYSTIEKRVRETVAEQVKKIQISDAVIANSYIDNEKQKVYVLAKVTKQSQANDLYDRLSILNDQLAEYKHTSQKGSTLEQLLSLVPVLPTLEERKVLLAELKALNNETPRMSNDQMAKMMDMQTTKLFDDLMFGVDALTADTEMLERQFVKALRKTGLTVSSRHPDLLLKYYLEPDMEEVEGQQLLLTTMTNDIEFLTGDSLPFATLSSETEGQAKTKMASENQALDSLANEITDTILSKILDYMNKVNEVNYQR